MTKVVYNACYGGFGLSKEAVLRYAELKGITLYEYKNKHTMSGWIKVPQEEYAKMNRVQQNDVWFRDDDIDRADPILVQVVEELGEKAGTKYANLLVEDIPKGTAYRITEYDGYETIETPEDLDWRIA